MQYLLFIERKNSKQAFGCLSENWNKCSGEPGGASGPVALNWSCFKLLFRWSDSLRQGSFLFRAFISPIIVIQTMSILVSSFYFANHSQRSPPGFTPRAPYWGTFAIISIFYISRGFCRRCKLASPEWVIPCEINQIFLKIYIISSEFHKNSWVASSSREMNFAQISTYCTKGLLKYGHLNVWRALNLLDLLQETKSIVLQAKNQNNQHYCTELSGSQNVHLQCCSGAASN